MRQVATQSRVPTGEDEQEDAMKRSTLIGWLMGLGIPLWLSSRVVDMHPAYAGAVVLAGLVFSAFAAGRPYRN